MVNQAMEAIKKGIKTEKKCYKIKDNKHFQQPKKNGNMLEKKIFK
jgi:hypothetical protein